ncbi:PD-(D/E)XK nuclease family protein, partial [bacterium]|nr:PD-(D/E)XK nuclease family protein [bacterium]
MHQTTDNFLEAVAKSLYQIHGQNIADLTIVFPNRRSGLFFTEYLNRIISGPTFSPEIITIQELFSNISNLRIEEQLLLIFRLYKIYRNLSASQESFDEFYLWGEMLLHDFDQVDKYLVDAELLFTNITDLKEIDQHFMDWNDERKGELKQFWSSQVSGNQKYDQKEFSQLWQILYPVYQKLREELLKEQIAYEGMLFRDAIENNECINSAYLSDKKFVIAGFNALNGCEKELFKLLKNRQMISFYWDYDVYYLNDLNQEAALFMRENLLSFPQTAANFETDNFKKSKKVRIYHTPSQIGQAQMAAKEISRSGPMASEFDDTAIVLCDEELLLPVLTSIPPNVETINVTMGLPLRQTPLFSLIGHLISLQKKGKKEGENYFFHYNSIIEILNNQFIQTLYPIECKSIVNEIVSKNKIFVSESELNVAPIFGRIFSGQHEVSALADYFLSILYELFQLWEGITGQNYTSNYLEYIFQVYLSLNKLKNTLFIAGQGIMGSNDFLNRETFFRLLLQYLHSVNITFEGEPLAGLQVMGILETRTLDFKNIVLLSVNEGIMPKSNSSGSFIPYHLRKGNGLPTTEEQNAMYAYYFYRLLQRAESVTFVYNSGSNGLKTGEKSRFIHQLQNESPFMMEDLGVEFSIDPMPVYPISIEKKGKVLETLGMYTDGSKTISPTALDLYLQCPLSFYFKYIAHFND